jgi:very-short-patch-repair endonuclease
MRGPKYVQDLAKDLRKQSTPAEALLWQALRDKQLDGVKFHRQRPFTRYVLDFYAPSVKLVIEVDGGVHETLEQKNYDQIRTDFLKENGLKVIRFTNEQVLDELEFCLEEIRRAIGPHP